MKGADVWWGPGAEPEPEEVLEIKESSPDEPTELLAPNFLSELAKLPPLDFRELPLPSLEDDETELFAREFARLSIADELPSDFIRVFLKLNLNEDTFAFQEFERLS